MTDVYIFEGADLVGKTTMAHRLAARLTAEGLDVATLHFSPPKPGLTGIELYLRPLQEAMEGADAVVVDRFYLGEDVYGPMLRGASVLTAFDRETIEEFLDQIGAKRFWVDEGDRLIAKRFNERGDDLLKLEQILKAAHSYRAIMESMPKWQPPEECDDCGFYFLDFELDEDGYCDYCSAAAKQSRVEQRAEDAWMDEIRGVEL